MYLFTLYQDLVLQDQIPIQHQWWKYGYDYISIVGQQITYMTFQLFLYDA